MNTYAYVILTLLIAAPMYATREIKRSAPKEQIEFFRAGADYMNRIIAECAKSEFHAGHLDELLADNSKLNALYDDLQVAPSSPAHQQAFIRYQSYLCGMRSVAHTYTPSGRSPQDAVIKVTTKFLSFALTAPDYQAILDYNARQLEAFNKRMEPLRWEILAEIP